MNACPQVENLGFVLLLWINIKTEFETSTQFRPNK